MRCTARVAAAAVVFLAVALGHLGSSGRAAAQWPRPKDPAATHAIPPFAVPPVRDGVVYERFFAIGDMGTGKSGQFHVGRAMAQRAKRDGLDFILTLGDNIYEEGVSSATDPQWESKFQRPYADPALGVPFYPTLGNHDHAGNTQAQIDYGKRNPNWKLPGLYYTFTRTLADDTAVQFFALDTTPIHDKNPSSGIQLMWLDQQLAQSRARWKIVFGHHPLYTHGPHGTDPIVIAALEPIFTKHGVDLYLAGHDHTLEMLKPVQGVHHVVSGAAGGLQKAYKVEWTDQAYYAATRGGFVAIRVSRDELVIEFVRPDAGTQYAHVLTK